MAIDQSLHLRPSAGGDLDRLLAAEADEEVRPRIVPSSRGQGHGNALVAAVCGFAFTDLDAHRLWLDVKQDNDRARRLHRRAGFTEEGVMRECLAGAGGCESLVLMSMLAAEHAVPAAGAGT